MTSCGKNYAVAFLRWAKTSLSPLAIILLGGWVTLPKCTLVKILHWILNKGRLDLDHGAGGGVSFKKENIILFYM